MDSRPARTISTTRRFFFPLSLFLLNAQWPLGVPSQTKTLNGAAPLFSPLSATLVRQGVLARLLAERSKAIFFFSRLFRLRRKKIKCCAHSFVAEASSLSLSPFWRQRSGYATFVFGSSYQLNHEFPDREGTHKRARSFLPPPPCDLHPESIRTLDSFSPCWCDALR